MKGAANRPLCLLAAAVVVSAAGFCAGGETEVLWRIGVADNDTRGFALAPGGYAKFAEDPLFIVGASDAAKDWPYVHPGPSDGWAGSRQHVFLIVFGLAAPPKGGECRLVVDLADTQGHMPPRLRITVNGKASEHATPRGAGDASVSGEPEKGKAHRFTVTVPADGLRRGTNEIGITTLSGSWVLYDAIRFEAPPGLELQPPAGTMARSVRTHPVLVKRDGRLKQTVQVSLLHLGPETQARVRVGSARPTTLTLRHGPNVVEAAVDAVETETPVTVTAEAGGKTLVSTEVTLKPVRKWVIYFLPHSHVDIGYTKVQTEVERDHWRFYEQAIEASQKTAAYPDGARFKWNVEVLWATDSYLKQATPAKRKAFIDAVKAGRIGLDALYGNELTALCRPEELVRLTDFARRLKARYDVPIDSAMISDVPGYTWGIVPVLAQSGVKYISIGPNGGHRIGYTLSEWGDKPFHWVSPCGKHRILVWIPRTGYWRGFRGGPQLMQYLERLEESDYPFDVVQIRHCLGDNAGPGVELCDFIKDWNTRYAYPKLIIATTREMFQDFAKRYAKTLPEVRGDFTPYWEDGAGSSARETGLARAAAERLVDAETLWAMFSPGTYPDADFYAAWRNTLLYDEHTWGAHNSIREPDSDFAKAQWKIKQAFALDADAQSRKLLAAALALRKGAKATGGKVAAIDVFNTNSWPRTDLVVLDKDLALPGDVVKDTGGKAVPSQRLTTGELAFLASRVPPLGAKRFRIETGKAPGEGGASAKGATLTDGLLTVTLDPKTGAIASLRAKGIASDLVDRSGGLGLNEYLYVAGRDPKDPKRNGPVKITVKERGPLVASLAVEGDAPGCRRLTREIRVVGGLGRVDITNVVDKEQVRSQESVHFAFPFNVPDGVMRMDVPWAVVRPETDQLPGACKNYFTVQRWTDVSNEKFGVTWATVEAPLVEVGRITVDATRVGWLKTIEPSQTLYSYVMNNYWETNYKADQAGPTVFRYAIRPHAGGYDAASAQRFGIGRSQTLVAVPVVSGAPVLGSRLRVEPPGVLVTAFKPSSDGKAWIVRLFNVSGRSQKVSLDWTDPAPGAVTLSSLDEKRGQDLAGPIEMAPSQIVTLRATLPKAAE